jgi:hypothetical protein
VRALFETTRGGFGAARWPGARVGVSPDPLRLGVGPGRPSTSRGVAKSKRVGDRDPPRPLARFVCHRRERRSGIRPDPHLELGSELELFSDFRSLSGDGLRAPNFIQIEGHAGVFHTGNSGYG